MTYKFSNASLFLSLFLSGLYGGIGFFILVGGNPSIALMSDQTFAEHWQHTDHYMAARMPVFGSVLMLSVLFTIITLYNVRKTQVFWLMLLAFCTLLADLVHTIIVNFPLNKQVQSWDLDQLPADVSVIKSRVIEAFWYRAAFMLSAFGCIVFAAFLYSRGKKKIIQTKYNQI